MCYLCYNFVFVFETLQPAAGLDRIIELTTALLSAGLTKLVCYLFPAPTLLSRQFCRLPVWKMENRVAAGCERRSGPGGWKLLAILITDINTAAVSGGGGSRYRRNTGFSGSAVGFHRTGNPAQREV